MRDFTRIPALLGSPSPARAGWFVEVPTAPRLAEELAACRVAWEAGHDHPPMSRQAADKALRQTWALLGLEGVSSHSFGRSLATAAWRRVLALNVVQQITCHKALGSLSHYLEADESEVLAAILGWAAAAGAAPTGLRVATENRQSPIMNRFGTGWTNPCGDSE